MRRCTLAVVAVLVFAAPVGAKRVITPSVAPPLERLLAADVVVVGKVIAIEKNPDAVTPEDKIAIIKVESALIGGSNLTELIVRFLAPLPKQKVTPIPIRSLDEEPTEVVLHKGDEGVFFLCKHYRGKFFTTTPTSKPILTTDSDYKDQLVVIKTGAVALTDPMKALRAEKVENRALAAHVLVQRYCERRFGEVETSKLSAPESRAILKALAEADWQQHPNDPFAPFGFKTFERLSLTEKDGWKLPTFEDEDDEKTAINKVKVAFAKWVDGAGKQYLIKKVVPKKDPQMVPPSPPQP